MTKEKDKTQTQEYVDSYNEMLKRLYTVSRMAARQFVGSDESPQAQYIVNIEIFKNLINYQVALLNRLVGGMTETDEFMKLACEALEKHLKTMEEELSIKSWDKEGNPVLNLEEFKERTAGWPQC